MNNRNIQAYLSEHKDKYLKKFHSISRPDELLKSLFDDLQNFDFEAYQSKLKIEIKENLKNWWINPDQGIVPEEALLAILFEYDYFYTTGVEALSYGIGQWKDFAVHTDKFDMGSIYDFTTGFYAAPGFTLSFFDLLEKLDHSNLPAQYGDIFLSDLKGHSELIELYKLNGLFSIHQVLKELNEEGAFEELNYNNPFMFMIAEHDSGEVYPLLIKEKV